MKLRAEISTWSDNTKNGVYLTDDSGEQCYAYAPYGINVLKYFKNPIKIDLRYRKFLDLYKFDASNKPPGIEVRGSKGDVYYVDNGKCTCQGFKFRGVCKHVEYAKQF